jgi:hypothetical protein
MSAVAFATVAATQEMTLSITRATERGMSANAIQYLRIQRCHRRLSRRGVAITVDQTARIWITRYAAAWRRNHERHLRPAA